MCKYPKVNYIGNKEKIADWIIDCFPIKKGVVLDLFSGGASVSYALKKSGFKVLSNDVLYSNYCISKALIENSNVRLNLNLENENISDYYSEDIYNKIKWMSNNIYFDSEIKELASLISYSNTLIDSEKFIFLSLLRRSMIRKIPYSRMNIKWEEIVKLRDEDFSYKKYKRRRAYHNKSFLYHIKDNLDEYNSAVFDNGYINKAYQKDALDMLKFLGKRVDLIYIDPPYPSTMNKYKEFYGAFDIMFDKEIEFIDFTNKQDFINNIKIIIKLAKNKTKYIALSLNNKSNPSYKEIINGVNEFVKKIDIYKKNHVYKVTGKDNKKINYEILLVMEV